jgi:segregation and condensation protein B
MTDPTPTPATQPPKPSTPGPEPATPPSGPSVSPAVPPEAQVRPAPGPGRAAGRDADHQNWPAKSKSHLEGRPAAPFSGPVPPDPIPRPTSDSPGASDPASAAAPAPIPASASASAPSSAPDPSSEPASAPPPDPIPDPAPASASGPDPDQNPAVGFEGDPTAWPPDEAFEAVDLDDRGWTRRDLEAILLVADEPVPAGVLAEIVGSRLSEVEELLVDLAGEYARDGRGFVLRAIAGGWRLYTNPGARTAVEAFLRAGQQSRLTRAALETLAVIAYRQPVTRFQVAAVRGVNVDGVFRTLASRGLIHEVGTDPGPGQAILYGTTPAFLEQLGLNDLDQLPPIKDYLPEGVELFDLQEQP